MSQTQALAARIGQSRWWLRYFAEQEGDDRCWLDDQMLYWHILGIAPTAGEFTREHCLANCWQFFMYRTEKLAPAAAQAIVEGLDVDLYERNEADLQAIFGQILNVVQAHHDIGERHRSAVHDRALVVIVPKAKEMDQRVPPNLFENCQRHFDRYKDDPFARHPLGP